VLHGDNPSLGYRPLAHDTQLIFTFRWPCKTGQSRYIMCNQSSSSSRPELTNKLGKDGKLTADKHKRCLDNNLCMFCGGTGHFTDNCPQRPKMPRVVLQPLLLSPVRQAPTRVPTLSQKRVSSSQPSAQPVSCIDSRSAPKEAHLNMSTLYDPNSLMPHVFLSSYGLPELHVLVDSGSMHCFVDTKYALGHSLSSLTPFPRLYSSYSMVP